MRPSELDVHRWRRIDEVFDDLLDHPPGERDRILDEACAGDDELRAEVEALLDAHGSDSVVFEDPEGLVGAALATHAGNPALDRAIGPFRVVREIGRGGMGVVYLAEDLRVGRYVALKVLPPYLGSGRDARRRFEAEARAVSTLDHPNIATLYETDESEEGQLYMAFAYYDGETLDRRIAGGPLRPDEAVQIAIQVSRGLQAAHESGIVHRDVKPSNVLLTVSGEVKLLDFGVAKGTGEDLTGDGVRPGTVAYMSPEHASGRSVDGRADLWSLGVVLYEMLAAERPFRGPDAASTLRAILHDEPESLDDVVAQPNDALRHIVRKLLAKRPEDRYQSARDLLEDLIAVQEGQSPAVALRTPALAEDEFETEGNRRPSNPWRRAGPAYAVALLATVALSGVWIAYDLRTDAGDAAVPGSMESIAVLPLENLTGDSDQEPFIGGVHDALVATLGRLGGIRVLSRTSVLPFRDTEMSIPEIARNLSVDGVVVGSVARDGDSLRVTVQLVAASPERQLWGESWRRGVDEVFEITGEVARSVAEELDVPIDTLGSARLTLDRPVDPRAYDAYTLGLYSLEQRSSAGFGQAENYLRRAIRIDPDFAPAYTALAQAYGSAAFFGLRSPARTLPSVRALADTAMRIDGTLATTHVVLSAVTLYGDWDWAAAERHARRAIELNPSLAGAHRALSEVLAVRGRLDQALASVRRGSELERFVPFSQFRPVVVLNYMDEFDQAVREARAGIEFFPDFWQGHWLQCQAVAGRGEYDAAVESCRRAVDKSDGAPMALASLGFAYAMAGRTEEGERLLAALEGMADTTYVAGSQVAMVHGALGHRDEAFEWLDRAYEERDLALVNLEHDPFFDPLRSDPRLDELKGRVGLPEIRGSGGL